MPVDAPILSIEHISKQFGGVRAVNDVSLEVRRGEILGLIGPNGAGKTTTFNLISGRFPASDGEIRFLERRITRMRPDHIAGLGIARTFQGVRIFPQLRVAENIETALFAQRRIGFWDDWLNLSRARAAQKEIRKDLEAILEFVGLSAFSHSVAGSLPYARQSLLGIGLALALKPKLLLLDEPFAGMNPRETADTARMVRRIRDTGVTILLVEHDMPAVMGVCDRIIVLDQGAKIAEGAPAEIRANQRVVEAYLGIDEDA